jgi:hypothetical protein
MTWYVVLYSWLHRAQIVRILPSSHMPGDLTISKRTGTSNRIEIQFRTFNHLSRPDSFAKLFETFLSVSCTGK